MPSPRRKKTTTKKPSSSPRRKKTAKKKPGTPSRGKKTTTKEFGSSSGRKKTTKKKPGSGPGGKKSAKNRRPASPSRGGVKSKRKRRGAASVSQDPGDPKQRLQKVLAAAGMGSRRKCEDLILAGRVEVDHEVITKLGVRVDPRQQEIRLDGDPLPRPRRVYYAVNKPVGTVCTAVDPSGRPRVIDLLPATSGRLFTVGRLDMNSEGLILLTNDGELANQLTHPRYGVQKTYRVLVAGRPKPEDIAKLQEGVYLSDGLARVSGIRIKGRHKQATILEMVLDEGKNREIRRVLARVGHKVLQLVRIAVGPIRLGDMPPGAYRRLTREEVDSLRGVVRKGKDS